MIVLADAGDPRPGPGRPSAQDRSKAGSAFDAALGAAKHTTAKTERHGHGKATDAAVDAAARKDGADDAEAPATQSAQEAEASVIAAEPAIEGAERPELSISEDGDGKSAETADGAGSLSSLLPDLGAGATARVSPEAVAALSAAAQAKAAGAERGPSAAATGGAASASGLSPTMRLAKVLAASFGGGDAQAPRAAASEAASAEGAKAGATTEAEALPIPMPTDDGLALSSTPGTEIARAADAATLRAAAALKPADAGIATAKIDVVAMRTHFEPHRHDPVLVGEEGGASAEDFAGRDETGADELLSALGGAKSSGKSSFDVGLGGIGGYGSPSSQIASAVASLVDPRDGHSSARGASEAGLLRYQAGGAALKSIRIQLQPEHLGKVDVSLRMVRGELAVEIATPLDATAAVLSKDADGLKSLLRRAGFTLDDAAVTIVVRDLAASASGSTATGGDAGASGAGRDGSGQAGQGASAEGRSAGGGSSGGESRRGPAGREGEAARAASAGGPDAPPQPGGSLYL